MTGTKGVGKSEMKVFGQFEVAFFVSSHGFGHAARACAVGEALVAARSDTRFGFYSEVPAWFFKDWYEKNLGNIPRHFPASKGWCLVYLGLMLWLGWALHRQGTLPW